MTGRRRKEPATRGKLGDSAVNETDREEVDSVLRDAESVLRDAKTAAAELRESAEAEAAERLREAEREAASLREEATDYLAAAQRRADELTAARGAQVSEVTDEMISRVRESADRTEQLLAGLKWDASRSVKASGSGRAKATSVSDGARLLATQMAVAGSDRKVIAHRLKEEFGIADPGAILDEIGL